MSIRAKALASLYSGNPIVGTLAGTSTDACQEPCLFKLPGEDALMVIYTKGWEADSAWLYAAKIAEAAGVVTVTNLGALAIPKITIGENDYPLGLWHHSVTVYDGVMYLVAPLNGLNYLGMYSSTDGSIWAAAKPITVASTIIGSDAQQHLLVADIGLAEGLPYPVLPAAGATNYPAFSAAATFADAGGMGNQWLTIDGGKWKGYFGASDPVLVAAELDQWNSGYYESPAIGIGMTVVDAAHSMSLVAGPFVTPLNAASAPAVIAPSHAVKIDDVWHWLGHGQLRTTPGIASDMFHATTAVLGGLPSNERMILSHSDGPYIVNAATQDQVADPKGLVEWHGKTWLCFAAHTNIGTQGANLNLMVYDGTIAEFLADDASNLLLLGVV